jgi:hypothetical protein
MTTRREQRQQLMDEFVAAYNGDDDDRYEAAAAALDAFDEAHPEVAAMLRPRTYHSDALGRVTIPED